MSENNSDKNSSIDQTGQRLRRVANRLHDGNKSELARSLGMKPSSFAKYLDGNRRPGAVVLERLSQLGVDINWLLTGDGAMLTATGSPPMSNGSQATGPSPEDNSSPQDRRPEQQFHQVPLVRIREDPGEGLRLVDTGKSEWVETAFIRQEYGVEPALLRDFHVTGDSMADTVCPGDRVRAVLWDCRSPNDGTVCILRGPVSLLIRRVRLNGTQISLVADNPDVPNLDISQEQWEEEYEQIARVLEVRRVL